MSASSLIESPEATCSTFNILLVGEGNLSFTQALVKKLSRSIVFRRYTTAPVDDLPLPCRVVTTTFDEAVTLATKYPETESIRKYLASKKRVSVLYLGDVNATAIAASLAADEVAASLQYHMIFFNNPHVGYEDLYRQRSLLSHFFASTRELLELRRPTRMVPQIVVALCDDQPRRWDLLGSAGRSGYLCVAATLVLPCDFPEYTNRRHQSDAAFPFESMVHYHFVRISDMAIDDLTALVSAMVEWREACNSRVDLYGSAAEDWVQMAEALCSSSLQRAMYLEIAPLFASAPTAGEENTEVNRCVSATSVQLPMPLLCPTRIAPTAVAAMGLRLGGGESPKELYCPYIPPSVCGTLYLQELRHLMERARSGTAVSCGIASELPPQLDEAKLGRPLTQREQVKLQRYLTSYGPAMRQREEVKKHVASPSVLGASPPFMCSECQPPRRFDTRVDLQQHTMSKHSGMPEYSPTLYARVHHQVALPSASNAPADLNALLEQMEIQSTGSDAYCATCGLQFLNRAAYEEHLRFLVPLPVESDNLICTNCEPVRIFTDRRAFEQHVVAKHQV